MEIRYTVIMLCNKFPDFHRVVFFAVKGTIDKFDLWHFVFQKESKFLFDQLQISEPKPLINRRKTVTA